VQRDPANALYQYHLGVALANNGDKSEARHALERALAIDSDFEGAAQARSLLAGLGL
jgi:hypothetical protein